MPPKPYLSEDDFIFDNPDWAPLPNEEDYETVEQDDEPITYPEHE